MVMNRICPLSHDSKKMLMRMLTMTAVIWMEVLLYLPGPIHLILQPASLFL